MVLVESRNNMEKWEEETEKHIETVQRFISHVCSHLMIRSLIHDRSKLSSQESELFRKYTPILAGLEYGSKEYFDNLANLKPALDHHYAANSHHPEHFENGVDGMTLIDLVEMYCDWKAATLRHNNADFGKSLSVSKTRFKISDQLHNIFENTQKFFGW